MWPSWIPYPHVNFVRDHKMIMHSLDSIVFVIYMKKLLFISPKRVLC